MATPSPSDPSQRNRRQPNDTIASPTSPSASPQVLNADMAARLPASLRSRLFDETIMSVIHNNDDLDLPRSESNEVTRAQYTEPEEPEFYFVASKRSPPLTGGGQYMGDSTRLPSPRHSSSLRSPRQPASQEVSSVMVLAAETAGFAASTFIRSVVVVAIGNLLTGSVLV
jgi:hypothetical protein